MVFAKKMGALPTKAVAMIKKIIVDGSDIQAKEVSDLELRCLKEVLGTNDVREGISAFLEKREPRFKGN
jgi:2-(1,2-epoxy-1,2-dihydrophenyl)acetyl-CoA isomerase